MKNIQDKICLRFAIDTLWKKGQIINRTVFSLVDKRIDGISAYYPVNEIIYLIKDELNGEHKE